MYMTPWYPLAGQVVEPVVHFGGGGHGLTHNPVVSHWLPGTGFLGALDAKHTVLCQRCGQLGGLGATAPALHTRGTSSVLGRQKRAARYCGEPVSGAQAVCRLSYRERGSRWQHLG